HQVPAARPVPPTAYFSRTDRGSRSPPGSAHGRLGRDVYRRGQPGAGRPGAVAAAWHPGRVHRPPVAAGGPWLAVPPDLTRVACILNARGESAPPDRRRSRGELPLRAAAEGRQALQ